MDNYDLIIVGASLYGSIFAYKAKQNGLKVLVVDEDNHIGMNLFSTKYKDAIVQPFGGDLIKTNDENVISFLKNFAELKDFDEKIKIKYNKVTLNIPLDLNSLYIIYGTYDVEKIKSIIEKDKETKKIEEIKTIEDYVISQVGPTLYNNLFKNLIKKIFKKEGNEVSAEYLKDINLINYGDYKLFDYNYVCYPINGYTELFDKLLEGIEVKLNFSIKDDLHKYQKHCKTLIYSSEIEKYFDYCHGRLDYIYLNLKHKVYDTHSIQSGLIELDNSLENKYFMSFENNKLFDNDLSYSVVTYFYGGKNISFDNIKIPVNSEGKSKHLDKYLSDTKKEKDVIFGGSLGVHKMLSIEEEVNSALLDFEEYINNVK